MEGSTRREEISPQLLDLFQTRDKNDTNVKEQSHVDTSSSASSDERVLELSLALGPPVRTLRNDSLLSLGYCSSPSTATKTTSSFLVSENNININIKKKKKPTPSVTANPAVTNNTSQKRTAPAPVVGWPPIRSFRKNISSSSKPTTNDHQSQSSELNGKINNDNNNKIEFNSNIKNGLDKSVEEMNNSGIKKGMFVKINMEGVPIGRKVDLKAYDTYDKLSSAVDQLFRGLLAAQRDLNGNNETEEDKIISGLMDGSGEYTLVYEDNEGDKMLCGDVPWNMFVSTVKRLRVLKSSELSLVRCKQGQMK